jgi:hypothetical protein
MNRMRTVSQWLALFDALIGDLFNQEDLHEVQKENVAERVVQQLVNATKPRRADLD